jgi:hypothetical protein
MKKQQVSKNRRDMNVLQENKENRMEHSTQIKAKGQHKIVIFTINIIMLMGTRH